MRADQSWLAGKVTCTLQHSLLNRQLHAVRYIACRKTAYMRQRCLQQGNIRLFMLSSHSAHTLYIHPCPAACCPALHLQRLLVPPAACEHSAALHVQAIPTHPAAPGHAAHCVANAQVPHLHRGIPACTQQHLRQQQAERGTTMAVSAACSQPASAQADRSTAVAGVVQQCSLYLCAIAAEASYNKKKHGLAFLQG